MNALRSARTNAASVPRIGFIGLGWIGRKRLDVIAERADIDVSALCDVDHARLASAHAEHPRATACDRLETLLQQDLDGVVIATPNASHVEQALACLARNAAVFCQKPLALDARDAEHVIEAAATANRLLAVDYSYRYVRGMDELRKRISSGELGEIRAIDLEFHNAYAPNQAWCLHRACAGGGCLLDLGIHLIDLARWLQGWPDMRVVNRHLYARGRAAGRQDLEDLAFVELEQNNGAIVRLVCSWHAQIGDEARIGMTVHGTCGGAVWRNIGGTFLDFELWLCRSNRRELIGCSLDDWGCGALGTWVDLLRTDGTFDVNVRETLANMRVIDEVYAA